MPRPGDAANSRTTEPADTDPLAVTTTGARRSRASGGSTNQSDRSCAGPSSGDVTGAAHPGSSVPPTASGTAAGVCGPVGTNPGASLGAMLTSDVRKSPISIERGPGTSTPARGSVSTARSEASPQGSPRRAATESEP